MGRGSTADRAAGRGGTPPGRGAVHQLPATLALLTLALGALACQSRDIASDPPTRTNVFITEIALGAPTEALDLVLVLDNSPGMADKHRFLARALPELFATLLGQTCFDEATGVLLPAPDGDCPDGESSPRSGFRDLHVGVITSSLGGHGGIACSPAEGSSFVPEKDERGELIAPLRGIQTPDDLGFFAWDGGGDPAELAAEVAELVLATGETGCGYEAPLEAFYRFLVDPMPPLEVLNDGAASTVDGINATLLEQRARFLRPDSAVAILVLSDENDCSVRDDGPGFYIAGATAGGKMPRGTQICATAPDDACCRSCALKEDSPPDGCPALSADPGCQLGPLPGAEEHPNLRCYEQKRRFGIDFLYPTARYVEGLRSSLVYGRACGEDGDCPPSPQQPEGGRCVEVSDSARYCQYTNPLLSENPYYPDRFPRSGSELIFFAGIVGVPWQDLATEATRDTPDELALIPVTTAVPDGESLQNRWDNLLGSEATGGTPLDPFLWESVEPRLGTHHLSSLPFPAENPLTGDAPAPPESEAGVSAVNGHELTLPARSELQAACSFALPTPRDCATATLSAACPCAPGDATSPDDPRCQAPGTRLLTTTQYAASATPGLRFLEVLHGFGLNAGLGSACPKLTSDDDATETAYGYRAALASGLLRPLLADRVEGLRCLPRRLSTTGWMDYDAASVDPTPLPSIILLEVTRAEAGVSCRTPGRAPPATYLADAVRRELERYGRCGATNWPSCHDFRICQLTPAEGQNLDLCLGITDDEVPSGAVGYCYVDAMQDRDDDGSPDCTRELGRSDAWREEPDCIGNPALVEDCPAAQRRTLRFLSEDLEVPVPHPEAAFFIVPTGWW